MKKLIVAFIVLAGAFLAEAEVTQPWMYNSDDRSGVYAPVAPATAQASSTAEWACPAWVESYATGGVSSIGLFIFIR